MTPTQTTSINNTPRIGIQPTKKLVIAHAIAPISAVTAAFAKPASLSITSRTPARMPTVPTSRLRTKMRIESTTAILPFPAQFDVNRLAVPSQHRRPFDHFDRHIERLRRHQRDVLVPDGNGDLLVAPLELRREVPKVGGKF